MDPTPPILPALSPVDQPKLDPQGAGQGPCPKKKIAHPTKIRAGSKIPNVRTRGLGLACNANMNFRLPGALKTAFTSKVKRARTSHSEVLVWAIAHYVSGDSAPRTAPGIGPRTRSAALLELTRRQSALLTLNEDLQKIAAGFSDSPLAHACCQSLLSEIKQLSEQSFRRLLALNHASKL